MVSNGAEHLASLPAYVINLDRSTHRWSLVASSIEPFVGSVTRVPGVDASILTDVEVSHFRDLALVNEHLSMRHDKTPLFWRGSMAVWLAHIGAISTGIDSRVAPFLILEDDARFYRQDLAALTDVPTDGDAYVWGGALKGSSHTGPARRYAEWDGQRRNTWSRITSPKGRHGATAIEFRTIAAAVRYHDIISENPHAYDISWWRAMDQMDIRVADMEVIQQCPILESDRARNNRGEAARLLAQDIIGR